ncbi:MAG: serine/threonine protein kinase [Myxococcaceae bacterium]|nr:serine/threonine protein kinase [Myxococcaceae bacterium]
MGASSSSAGQRVLDEHLKKDAPAREASVARYMSVVAALASLTSVALGPFIGWRLGALLVVVLGAIAAFFFVQDRALRRGWYRPGVRWVNVAIEVSAPSLLFLADSRLSSVEYALTAPPLVLWGTLVSLSGFRGSRALALGAGAIAALEYSLLYVFVAWPRLGPDTLVTLRPPLFAVRVLLLFSAGVVTALFVGHFNRRAAEALSAVRAKDVMGKYLLHERVGAGGMAEVFKATYSPEGGFEKTVALKKVLPAYAADGEFLKLFRLEAELCSRLNHPNVVQVLDFGRHGDSFFLAMEYIDGLSLKRVLDVHQAGGLPLPAVSFLAIELCQALDYVHRRVGPDGAPMNLIHRDLNPPNVLLSTLGEVKVADFGIARAASRTHLTQVGHVKGKPGYLAPEQAAGEPIDGRVDLFALGATLHEALTGRRLFPVGDDLASQQAVFTMPIPRPSQLRPEVPAELDAVVMALLERDLTRRTPSAREAREALLGVMGAASAFPSGQAALAAAVKRALVEWPELHRRATEAALAQAETDVVATPWSGKNSPRV